MGSSKNVAKSRPFGRISGLDQKFDFDEENKLVPIKDPLVGSSDMNQRLAGDVFHKSGSYLEAARR